MDKTFHLRIVTPQKVYEDEMIEKMSLVTDNGEVTILPNHSEYLANVEISLLKIYKENQEFHYAVGGGAFHYYGTKNFAVLILNSICASEEVDVLKLKKEEERLQLELKNAKSIEDHKKAELNLRKVINQLSLKSKNN